ncbi:putative LPXTG-motif cell wall anchor domain protein [Penicillium brasilianum]|uniref:Putative LPXTG-motif cell wall anchor domain protein n=1 Tax=Penicillium brasilianum TaxID=104259 RepID=A0A1S9RCB7_PENBI|nr:putative LPXTG-motif cell wall anchor domain protein [Penicillium brasilianum]
MMALTWTSTTNGPSLHHTRSSFEPWAGPTSTTATATGETPVPGTLDSLTPKRSSLVHRSHQSRRSVPSFHLPSLQTTTLTASASASALASTTTSCSATSSSNRNSAPVVTFSPNILSGPNDGRPQQDSLSPVLRPDVKRTMPSSVAYSETRTLASDHSRALNGAYRLGSDRINNNDASEIDEGRPKNEDVFLNIARTDSGRRDSLGRSDFRRSRLGYSTQSLRSPTTRADPEQTPSPDQRFSNVDSPLLSQNGSPTVPLGSVNHSPSASGLPLDDPARFRYSSLTSGSRSVIGAPRSRLSRTSPETSPRSPPVNGDRRSSIHEPRLRHSTLSTIRSSRQPSSSEVTERARGETDKARDGTESTLSTNAPSTVWDELDDLKSRIRKLELTGKLPPSSQEAISGAAQERPRTAATTLTALSTSPKHHRKVSTPSADADYVAQSQVHPLLQSALAKAKDVLTSDVYTALEATIKDALTLSTMLGVSTAPSGTVSVVNGGYSSSERHARRKADSVCRSLTELCLALTDKQLQRNRSRSTSHVPGTQPQRVNGDESEPLVPGPSYQRAPSHEPEGLERRPSTSSRMSSRLEARRMSLMNPATATAPESKLPPSPNVAPPPSRLHRMSASLRGRRPPAEDETPETASPLNRSLSRAMTEVGTPSPAQNVSPRQRLSHSGSVSRSFPNSQQQDQQDQGVGVSPRTSQYQQTPTPSQTPQAQPRTPTTLSQSSIPFRRSYMAPAVYSPATSRSNIQAGSRRYGLPSSFSSTTPGSVAEESPQSSQLGPAQTRISVPSGKSATSYTPIQQPRLRTNSLGTRRFGLRRRSAATPDDTFNLDDSID